MPRRVFIIGAGVSAECGAPTISNFLSQRYLKLVDPRVQEILTGFLNYLYPHERSRNIEAILSEIDDKIANSQSYGKYSISDLQVFRDTLVDAINQILSSIWNRISHELGIESIDNPYAALIAPMKQRKQIIGEKRVLTLQREIASMNFQPEENFQDDNDGIEISEHAQGWLNTYGNLVRIIHPGDIIINFNYDNFLELAIVERINRSQIDYGIDFHEFSTDEDINCHGVFTYYGRPSKKYPYRVSIFRLHGSLSWGICSQCGSIYSSYLTPIPRLKRWINELRPRPEDGDDHIFCCRHFDLHPFIVPPTWMKQKSYENECLTEIIEAATQQISQASSLYFLGYSFSDSDIVIRDLISDAKKLRGGLGWDTVQVVDIALDSVIGRYQNTFENIIGYKGKVSEFLNTMPSSTSAFSDPPKEFHLNTY